MVWQNPSPLSGRVHTTPHGLIVHLAAVAWFIASASATLAGCGGQTPAAPAKIGLLTISGYVHAEGSSEAGEPTLGDAVVTVHDAEGASRTATSDVFGFYAVPARAGAVTITVSKDGYESRSSSFDIAADTVLNFSLTPLIAEGR